MLEKHSQCIPKGVFEVRGGLCKLILGDMQLQCMVILLRTHFYRVFRFLDTNFVFFFKIRCGRIILS